MQQLLCSTQQSCMDMQDQHQAWHSWQQGRKASEKAQAHLWLIWTLARASPCEDCTFPWWVSLCGEGRSGPRAGQGLRCWIAVSWLLPASVSHSFNRAITALARLEGRGGAGEQELPQHFGKRKCSVSAVSLLSATPSDHKHGAIASHLKSSVAITLSTTMAWGGGQGEGLLTKVMSTISDSAFSFSGSQTASVGSMEQALPRGACPAGVLGSRQDIVKGVLRGTAASLMTPLAARQGAMWLLGQKSPLNHETPFFPLWLYLFFSEVKRKQNVPTKLSTLKLYCSPMTQGEKFKGDEEEGKHSWIRSVVLSLKEEDDFAGWRAALLQHSEQEAKDGT